MGRPLVDEKKRLAVPFATVAGNSANTRGVQPENCSNLASALSISGQQSACLREFIRDFSPARVDKGSTNERQNET